MKTKDYSKYQNTEAMRAAVQTAEALKNSPDKKYIRYRDSRPIMDLKHMMDTSVELYADLPAFHQRFEKDQPFRTITYQQAYDDMTALGSALIEHGLKDKRVAVIGENCYQWALSYLAVTCGVGVVVPLDKELNANELKQLVVESESSAVLCSQKYEKMFLQMIEDGDTKLEFIVNFTAAENKDRVYSQTALIEEGKALVAGGDRRFIDADIDAFSMGVLLFTSGTTGIAKGVMLSHRNICEDLMIAPTILTVHTWDVFFSVLPVHHTYECTCGFLMPLYKGASIAYCEGLKYILKNLKEVQPTMLLAVPLIFESLYKNIMKTLRKAGKEGMVRKLLRINKITSKIGIDLNKKFLKQIYEIFGGRMRVLISGGAAIDPAILDFFNDLGFIAVQGYGLTECAPMAALNPDVHKLMRNASVGHVMPNLQGKIDHPDETGVGEICIKGANVMLGYYNMPEETAKVLKDGWFHTGDLGYMDDEDFIYITGRAKNVIITRNGKNVFPEELEYYLGKSDLVSESMVWGMKDESGQDTLIAATIKPDEAEIAELYGAETAADLKEVEKLLWKEVDKINETLPLFKQIRKVVVREEDFDKTTGKKIKRFVEENKNQ